MTDQLTQLQQILFNTMTEIQLISSRIQGILYESSNYLDCLHIGSNHRTKKQLLEDWWQNVSKFSGEREFIHYCLHCIDYLAIGFCFDDFFDFEMKRMEGFSKRDKDRIRGQLDRLGEFLIALKDENGENI